MKHVKKKFIKSVKVGEDVKKVFDGVTPDTKYISQLQENNFKGHFALVLTDKDYLIQSFMYQDSGTHYAIIEPDPIVLYFESARHNAKLIPQVRKKLLEEVDHMGKTSNNMYQFYQLASITAIFMFTSCEALINKLIPNDFEYRRVKDSRTELFNRFQIQSELSFEEKTKKVLSEVSKKSFHVEFSHKYESILKLKEFRDSIAHTKSDYSSPPGFYRELYTTALDFKYEEVLLHVKDFINYYDPNLIEPCDCGKDY